VVRFQLQIPVFLTHQTPISEEPQVFGSAEMSAGSVTTRVRVFARHLYGNVHAIQRLRGTTPVISTLGCTRFEVHDALDLPDRFPSEDSGRGVWARNTVERRYLGEAP